MNKLYIALGGTEDVVFGAMQPGDELVALKQGLTFQTQLADIPKDKQIVVVAPESWEEEKRIKAAQRIQELCQAIITNRNTFSRFTQFWEESAFWNHERFLEADTVASIHHPEQPALICGNGPSLDTDWFDGISYACYHCVQRISSADYIAHIDAVGFGFGLTQPPRRGIIATPGACPEFLQNYPDSNLYAYLSDHNPIDNRFAQKTGLPMQPIFNGTVTDMLLNVAILAGHKRIYFSGVDLGFETKEEADEYYQDEVLKVESANGKEIWCHHTLLTHKKGFEQLAALHPDIEFIQTSPISPRLHGFTHLAV